LQKDVDLFLDQMDIAFYSLNIQLERQP